MSFMFNPYPYEDPAPVNEPHLSDTTVASIVTGPHAVTAGIVDETLNRLADKRDQVVIGIDGYVGAEWAPLVNLLCGSLRHKGFQVDVFDVADQYKAADEIDAMLAPNLPLDRQEDPVLLFGKLFEGGYETLFDAARLDTLKQAITRPDAGEPQRVVLVYGAGAASGLLRPLCDLIVYLDVTPKRAVIRIKEGRYKNLGDQRCRPFREAMRRSYYYDFELAMHLRRNLLAGDCIDFYVASDHPESLQLIPRLALNEICASLVQYPFRCKPVYLEGVWGGHYIKRLRGLPAKMKNCAWVFDLIPLEVSLLVRAGDRVVEIPFFAFVNKVGDALMGKACVDTFKGYFPIRFNYDDTYHSSGNMSMQIHPPADYCRTHFNELGRQDESYYVVATGHDARTYIGLNEDADAAAFIAKVKRSEIDFTPVDYETYVSHVPSKPGVQLQLPAGTIHSSGRNQVILEIGSLTVGSYTFKLYDYLRPDLDGVPRPIHSAHGERVLDASRTEGWVRENLVQTPRKIRSGDGWAEYVLGDNPLLYFNLYRYEFERQIEGDTAGVFHVLTLVDGERVAVYPKAHPERRYIQKYLDIVVVPANVGPYVVENLGDHPICLHKTCLKADFKDRV